VNSLAKAGPLLQARLAASAIPEDAMSLDGGNEGHRLEVGLDDQDDQHHPSDNGTRDGGGAGLHGDEGQGAAAEDGGGGNHDPAAEADAGPVTETIAGGLISMQQRKAAIEQQ
ncbi:hypothetical protein Agub_g14306, partial [Astrephomene gubernaculifera]